MNLAHIVVADTLHVREKPKSDSESLDFIHANQNVIITDIDRTGTWGACDYKGKPAWGSLKYLMPISDGKSPWLAVACREIGIKEVVGKGIHPRISAYFASVDGMKGSNDDEIAWCSCFINWCVEQINLFGSNDAAAQSWKDWRNGKLADSVLAGSPTAAKVGDIAVFERVGKDTGKGHVAIFLDYDAKNDLVLVLGGNQSDSVRYAYYTRTPQKGKTYMKLLTLRSM